MIEGVLVIASTMLTGGAFALAWWSAAHQLTAQHLEAAQLLAEQQARADEQGREYGRTIEGLLGALKTAEAIAASASKAATTSLELAARAEKEKGLAEEEMALMRAQFAVRPSLLPEPMLGKHSHQFDTDLGDGMGWRCGRCGDPKGNQERLSTANPRVKP